MELHTFKTLWGHEGPVDLAVEQALENQFNGLEGPAPGSPAERHYLKQRLASHSLAFIGEICTAGSSPNNPYVPDRNASLQQHLDSLETQLIDLVDLEPLFVTCLGGCDAWSEATSLSFFEAAIERAAHYDLTISFETHRGRSFFNPWVTQRIVEALPELLLTCDFSHWCVVCERLIDTEIDVIEQLAHHAHHIHGRVGYDQGPQVPHPGAPEYEHCLIAHQQWWEMLWRSQQARGYDISTLTPEFGPDGYLHLHPFTQEPVADLWEINCWMADLERAHFERTIKN